MPELVRGPLIDVRSRVFDSARWHGYRARPDDIVIATYAKCGTTWTQRIVSMLIAGSARPTSVWELSPWPDMRIFAPIEEVLATAEAQTHRRFFKSHLPFDALPVHDGCKFIHVARDGRDAAMSFHNHLANFTPAAFEMLDRVSTADPKFGDPFPRAPEDPARFFDLWLADDAGMGDPAAAYFHLERSYWAARRQPNLLLVHYNDLKRDRESEMRRIAAFLDIEVAEELWPELVEAAGFEAMKRDAQALLPLAEIMWEGGPDRFLHKGSNGRWREVLGAEALAAYDAKVRAEFPPALAAWLEHGRLVAGDPRQAPD